MTQEALFFFSVLLVGGVLAGWANHRMNRLGFSNPARASRMAMAIGGSLLLTMLALFLLGHRSAAIILVPTVAAAFARAHRFARQARERAAGTS